MPEPNLVGQALVFTEEIQANPNPPAVDENDGYAARFERRPEFLFGQVVPDVIDTTSSLRERSAEDLKVFYIPHVFSGKDEVFLGFGKPNAYLTVPDGKGGYQKFAAFSLWRKPAAVVDTRNFVQSGILFRLRGLPAYAIERLHASMQEQSGKKYATCVNANARVLEGAGFASGRKPLSSIRFPYQFLRTLLRNGLSFEGLPVKFEVIRTTPDSMERYTVKIGMAEAYTFCRHAERALTLRSKKSKGWAFLNGMLQTPTRLLSGFIKQHLPAQQPSGKRQVAPALASNIDYADDLTIEVSTTTLPGMLLRLLWGPHALFLAEQSRVKVEGYLATPLKAFSMPNPSLATKIKMWFLFSRPVIWLIRLFLTPDFQSIGLRNERNVYDMLRTHSQEAPNKYNLVIVGPSPKKPDSSRIIIARTTVGLKLVDWVLSKHVLMSGYDRNVMFAGELWKDGDGVIHLNANSGTYRPGDRDAEKAAEFIQAVFPHLKVVADELVLG